MPLNSPGSPAQWPAVRNTVGVNNAPEQRNAGLPGDVHDEKEDAAVCVAGHVPWVIRSASPGAIERATGDSHAITSRQAAAVSVARIIGSLLRK
jgi:uncharacterized protein (DUF2345 family)